LSVTFDCQRLVENTAQFELNIYWIWKLNIIGILTKHLCMAWYKDISTQVSRKIKFGSNIENPRYKNVGG